MTWVECVGSRYGNKFGSMSEFRVLGFRVWSFGARGLGLCGEGFQGFDF